MKIAIGCDHAAYEVKEILTDFIKNMNHEIIDYGTFSSESVDYPIYGHKVGESIKNKTADKGIVICGTGIGISIAANKIFGVRAALCTTIEQAILSRQHNDSNVLALGARTTSITKIKDITKYWIETSFEGGRHLKRINQIEK